MKTTRLDTELLDSKQFAKYAKYADEKNAKELIQKPKEELEKELVEAELYMQKVKDDTSANQKFQQAKEVCKDMRSAERETLNPIKAKYALIVAALRSLKANP